MPEFDIRWVMTNGPQSRSFRQSVPAEDADYAAGVARRTADAIRLGANYTWTLTPGSITATLLDPDVAESVEGRYRPSGARG